MSIFQSKITKIWEKVEARIRKNKKNKNKKNQESLPNNNNLEI